MDNTARHLSDEELAGYCGRRLPPAALLAADDHLALCDACHARVGKAMEPLSDKLLAAAQAFEAAAEAGEASHLSYEQLAALANDRLGAEEREVAAFHLEICRSCEAELDDLRELSKELAAPAATPAAPSREQLPATARHAPSLGERLRALWLRPAFRFPAQAVAATLAVMLLALLLFNIFERRRLAKPLARVADLEQDGAELGWREPSTADGPQPVEEERLAQDGSVPKGADAPQTAEQRSERPLVALSDGGARVTLDSQGNLTGLSVSGRDEGAVRDALQSGRIRFPTSLRELRGQSGTLMGDEGKGFSLHSPVGVVIETNRPTLSWSALAGATGYSVTVYDESLARVAASGPLTTTRWALGEPLARGRTYIWQVRATLDDGGEVIAPPAAAARVKFRVLEQAEAEALERARRQHANSHLVLGLKYAEAGLLDEAEREFRALLTANPESPVARRLLESVRAARR